MMKELRPIQAQKSVEAHHILSSYGFVYIAGEVRSGKTATSMYVADLYGAKNVLFLTKKKAISSIIEDYHDFGYNEKYSLTVINDESMHKLENTRQFDLIIHDEHHRFGAFPKPGKYTKMYRDLFFYKPQIFLSGTPSPETSSQMYHQLWVTNTSPWKSYTSFYKWANVYVDKKQKRIGTHIINDYSKGDTKKIMADLKKYMVTMTQAESGFKSKVEEEFLYVDMQPMTYKLCDQLMKDLVIEGKEEYILADTPAKLQQKLHQMYSGTIKFESGNRKVLDYSKVDFILNRFKGRKIALFYKFIAEYQALKDRLGDKLTDDIEEFNDTDKWIALQVVSGREGVNLSKADYLVMYNIDFSATSYWQARDRMTVKGREENKVYWIFSKDGIEDKVHKAVSRKKSYTSRIFKKDFNLK
jgi:hypothetical protein